MPRCMSRYCTKMFCVDFFVSLCDFPTTFCCFQNITYILGMNCFQMQKLPDLFQTYKGLHSYLYHFHEKYQDLFKNENLIFVLTYTAKLIASITQTRHFLLLFCLPFIACKWEIFRNISIINFKTLLSRFDAAEII